MKKLILLIMCTATAVQGQNLNIMSHLHAIGMQPPAYAPIHAPGLQQSFAQVTTMLSQVKDNGGALAQFLVVHRPLIMGKAMRGYAKQVARYHAQLEKSTLNNEKRAMIKNFGGQAVVAAASASRSGVKTWKKWAIGAGSAAATLVVLALLARWRMNSLARERMSEKGCRSKIFFDQALTG